RLDREEDEKRLSSEKRRKLSEVVARGQGFNPAILLYQKPAFSGDERLFFDLTAYAPGLVVSSADVQAVLDAEALPRRPIKMGTIDPAARKLIDRARAAGWQTITVPGVAGRPPLAIAFNGAGH